MICSISVPFAMLLHQNYPIIKNHKFLDEAVWFIITGVVWDVVFDVGYDEAFHSSSQSNIKP
jgi:hypothetical protein